MIASYAFADCTSLESITLNYTGLQEYAFKNCTGLKSITVPASTDFSDKVYKSGSGYVEISAFDGCVNVEEVTLTVGSIPSHADDYAQTPWYMSQKCPRIILEEGVTNVGSYSFYGDGEAKLGALIIPDSVTTIVNNAYIKDCFQPFLLSPIQLIILTFLGMTASMISNTCITRALKQSGLQ